MKLKDKVAVITGGNSGIGLAIAKEFKAQGASVAICGLNRETLDAAQSTLGSDVLVVQADISNLSDLDRFYAAVAEKFGKIDVVVANAGASGFMPMEKFDEATFDRLTNVNFKGTFFTVQKALPLLNDGASIILMSANGQSRGLPGATAIAATKAAVRSLARTISADLVSTRGIRANCISPGPIDTPLFDRMLPADKVAGAKERYRQMVPLKRMGTAEEVAKAALFLACSDSSYVVGEEIRLDGGDGNL